VTGCRQIDASSIALDLRIIPRSSRTAFAGFKGDVLRLQVKAPPVEGAANRECIRFLSKTFRVPKVAVELARGRKSRNKVFLIRGVPLKQAESVIQEQIETR